MKWQLAPMQTWRKVFDWTLSTPRNRIITRVSLLGLLGLSVAQIYMVIRVQSPQLKARRARIQDLFNIERTVDHLRYNARQSLRDSVEANAFGGVFVNWQNLANWIENVRTRALAQESELEWKVSAVDSLEGRYPGLSTLSVEFVLVPADPSYRSVTNFVRQSTEIPGLMANLEELQYTADDLGVTQVKFTIRVWLRRRHG